VPYSRFMNGLIELNKGLRMMQKQLIKMVYLLLLLWAPLSAAAPIDSLIFETQLQEDRFKQLVQEIRCVKCQNTNIAGSNADLARDHRMKVYEMMKQGKSDDEIRHWFVVRYGDFVLYRPQIEARTWLLWGLPLLLIPVGAWLLLVQLRRQRVQATEEAPVVGALSESEQKKLDEVLK